jgi:integrase
MACFRLPDGRYTQRSTGSTDRKVALKVALQFEEASRQGRERRLTETRARKTIADIFAIANRDALPSSSVEDFLSSWLTRKGLEVGRKTIVRYEGVRDDFIEHLGPRSSVDVAHLTVRDVTAFRDRLAKRLSANSVNIALKIVRSALSQAKRDVLIDSNVAEQVGLIKNVSAFERRPFTVQELKRIIAVADDEWRSMILFGLYTGQRIGDIASLRWSNIDTLHSEIRLNSAKTGRRQIIPIATPLMAHIQTLAAGDNPDAPLFPRSAKALKSNAGGGTLSNRFYNILVAAGMAKRRPKTSTGKGRDARRKQNALSFHSLRHTTTSLLKNAGTNDAVARDIVGHESRAVSANYTHIDDETKRKALNRLPAIL